MSGNGRNHVVKYLLVVPSIALVFGLWLGVENGGGMSLAQAAEAIPKGTFVNIIQFPPLNPGKEAEFLEWFRWSNEIYAKHKGFISRTLLAPVAKGTTYAAIVEHESKDTFMAMHLSKEREKVYERVEPLLERRPAPRFFEAVVSTGK